MHYKGIVIHPDELSDYWLDRLEGTDINFLGIHPVGKSYYGETVAEAVEWVQKPETQRLLERAAAMGIAVTTSAAQAPQKSMLRLMYFS